MKLKLKDSIYVLEESEDVYQVIFTGTRKIKRFRVDDLVKEVVKELKSEKSEEKFVENLSQRYPQSDIETCLNSLELLWKTDLRKISGLIVSPFVSNPSAAIVLTSVMARSEVKYGAKAFPFSLIEAGHMGQNLTLAATGLNIGSCPIGGFVNETLSEVLDLTDDEIPLYVISLGKSQR